MKVESKKEVPFIAASLLGAALLALGIGFMAPAGEQAKLAYNGDLWCVSNFIEERPYRELPDGRAAKDPLLVGKEDWVVREQVAAQSKEEAENKTIANSHGAFAKSNADELREKLKAEDKDFFTSHFNEGATVPGPCLGTGDKKAQIGSWLNQKLNNICGFDTGSSEYETVGKITINLTTYSPNMENNICDTATGGPPSTADGGRFEVKDSRIRWTKDGINWSDFVFAEPSTDNIIAWSEIDQKAVVIPGFNSNQPIRVADHYAPGLHANENYLDLFVPCAEVSKVQSQLQAISAYKGSGIYEVEIVDLTRPKPKVDPNAPKKYLPDGSPCPDQAFTDGPAEGLDYRNSIAEAFAKQLSQNAVANAGYFGDFGSFDVNFPPAYTGPSSAAGEAVLKVAQSQVGYRGNDDCTKYNTYSIGGSQCWAWCAAFVTWAYNQAGLKMEVTGSTARMAELFQNGHTYVQNPAAKGVMPMPGDVFWMHSSSASGFHVGIAESIQGNMVYTIEGNVTGDVVARRRRPLSSIVAIGRW